MTGRTPTPWRVSQTHPARVISANGIFVADCNDDGGSIDDDVAARIVLAVNCHDDLVKALESILADEDVALSRPDYIAARAALAKAGAGS